MPPIKKYIFYYIKDDNIRLEIYSYSIDQAFRDLIALVRSPEDFELRE